MAITYGAQGTAGLGTRTCSPLYPAGISATTSELFAIVCGRSSTADEPVVTPSGWTSLGQLEGGAGTFGVDTGPRRIAFFRKDTVTGTESGSVLFEYAVGNASSVISTAIFRIERTAGYTLSAQFASGADSGNDTSFAVTSSTSLDWNTGDLLLVGVAQNLDSGTRSSVSISATGVTFGTRTSRIDIATTNGNDVRRVLDTVPVTSADTSAAATYSHTISAAGSGVAAFLLLTETPTDVTVGLNGASITASAGDVEPPPSRGQAATFAQESIAAVALTLALVGSAITCEQGTTTANADGNVALTGQSTTVQAGSLAPGWAQALTGSESTSALGSVAHTLRPSDVVGQTIAASAGTVTAEGPQNTDVHLSGVEATFNAGFVQGGYAFLDGQESTGSLGAYTLSLDVPLSGEPCACAQGMVSPEQDAIDTRIDMSTGTASPGISAALSGEAVTLAQGDFTVTGDTDQELTGAASTFAAGSVGLDKQFALTGSQFEALQYFVGAPGGAELSGSAVSVVAGNVFVTTDREFALTGQAITASAGTAEPSPLVFPVGQFITLDLAQIGPVNVGLTGAEITVGQGQFVIPANPITSPAGRGRKKGKKYVVEIDGEEFEVSSADEALALLERARDAAQEQANTVLDRAIKAQKRPTRKVLADARKALQPPEIVASEELETQAKDVMAEIDEIYKTTLQEVEAAALKRKAEDDEDDALIGLLL